MVDFGELVIPHISVHCVPTLFDDMDCLFDPHAGPAGNLKYARGNMRNMRNEVSAKHFTRAQRKASTSTYNKSAITDHVAASNHTIGWEDSKILCRESHWTRRWIKEAIHIIEQSGHTMNRDMGNYQLPKIYHSLIRPPPPPGEAHQN